ncbi:MAG TPA: hypothetical protein VN420_01125 [Candidatus Fimivivens sp.]|nr:hypothetical protein [Candidatus Fimivivens sp.]
MPRLSEYLFTPKDVWTGFRMLVSVVKKSTARDVVGVIVTIVLMVVLFRNLAYFSEGVFFWPFFFVMLYWDLDSRISIGAALAGLVAIMIVSIFANADVAFVKSWPEAIAVWVYFFLVIGVVKQIWDMRKPENRAEVPEHVIDTELAETAESNAEESEAFAKFVSAVRSKRSDQAFDPRASIRNLSFGERTDTHAGPTAEVIAESRRDPVRRRIV